MSSFLLQVQYQMNLRGVLSEKEQLIKDLNTLYLQSKSEHDFYDTLTKKGYHVYQRNGIPTGIQQKRRFRFKTLGFNWDILKELDAKLSQNRRLDRLQQIRKIQSKDKDRDLGQERERI